MPRVPYKPEDIAEPRGLVEAMRQRRGGKLNTVDRMLLHSPSIAEGWNVLFAALRAKIALDEKYREMAICGVAILHGNQFEVDVHAPIYLKAGGTRAQLEALRHFRSAPDNALFNATERAVMKLVIESTERVHVSDETIAAVRTEFPDAQVVELVTLIGAYNMAARFIAALGVE
jgi:alkylhydroperoxidase family enzyme